jgi:hypothetical protein
MSNTCTEEPWKWCRSHNAISWSIQLGLVSMCEAVKYICYSYILILDVEVKLKSNEQSLLHRHIENL